MQENFYPRGNDSADDMCGTSHISEIYSPDKTRKAISYSYDCGATTGFNTKITLAAANQSLADTPKSADVYGVDKEGVTITWIDNKKLLIQHSPFHRVFHFKHEYNEINVYSNSKINPSKP